MRGQEVYIATVSVDANGEFTDDGLEVLSAITLAESAKPPDPDMTSVYIAIGVIVGSLCLTAAVLYFISPSKRERSGYLFILPAILLLATLTFYPVGYGIYLSFTDESAENYGQGEFVGLDNYETLFSDERTTTGMVTLVLENLHIHASLDFRLCGNAHAVGRHVRYVT